MKFGVSRESILELITTERINVAAQVVLALIALFALIYAIRQYRLSKKRFIEDSRPYIFIELETSRHGLLDLVITNAGKSAAKNIKVEFSPNIAIYDHSKMKINSYKFLKDLKFLAADKSFSFFFGSIIGGKTKICRQFTVSTKYQDVEGNDFTSEQVIDPRDFLELVSITRKDVHDVAKSLEDIKKELKTSNDNTNKLVSTIGKGLVRRGSAYESLTYPELVNTMANLLTYGVENVYNTFPMEQDAKVIAKLARDKLIKNGKLTKKDRRILASLNKFESSEFDYKTQEIVDEFLEAVK